MSRLAALGHTLEDWPEEKACMWQGGEVEPKVGFEPTTVALRMRCSAS